MEPVIKQRKADHIDLCVNDEVGFRGRTTLLENVQLVHQSLPEFAFDQLDTSVELLGKRLRAPLLIAAMTGGDERAVEINAELSAIAEARGIGFGLGSQRAMLKNPETVSSYQVRDTAPTTLVLGNIGIVQARENRSDVIGRLATEVGADALCVHMNPAMEIIQAEGDRDFRGCADTLARLVRDLPVPVVAKEAGSGISVQAARKIRRSGVRVVDVSGAGGTSWVGVEALRAREQERELGELLWDWGVPTAASVVYAMRNHLSVIATGGIRTGLDVARAIALGAKAAGIARPVLKAYMSEGRPAAEAYLDRVLRELSTVMLLCGTRSIEELQRAPYVITGELQCWMSC
jgi:isopentenyl-diphosphate delta-isomerase